MNKEIIEELKKKLEENKLSLEDTLSRFAKKNDTPEGDWSTVFPKNEGHDIEEMADEVEEYSSLIKIEHSLEVKLKNINDALKRIEEGRYGYCEKCNEEISYKKLSVTPETKSCQNCQ